MELKIEPYLQQVKRWPQTGRHVLAQFDADAIVVYQAYRPSIGRFAVQNGYFGGEFRLTRMSWIKPNFLWMMYRCGWGSKTDQESVLAVKIKRSAFDQLLSMAVSTSYDHTRYSNISEWKKALKRAEVLTQWDPDHDPTGAKCDRRAIQLGLRGSVLAQYAKDWIIDIQDLSPFVREQRENAYPDKYDALIVPKEEVYPMKSEWK
ncbi:DUF4291 domain-containing protein [Desmospora activa]|uniref:Uncharacterized protein DUF4291 n=1 Tax=Desmospora activa DSM 45169 TaxID=1121389 RepID=A0A2T4Z746_9BACL|nr:DUF4291 domain-containing protein [Desmospora activa]PTM57703.1 uncharacterized protein DUF4291 [Desmospora activa DSM 45169]